MSSTKHTEHCGIANSANPKQNDKLTHIDSIVYNYLDEVKTQTQLL